MITLKPGFYEIGVHYIGINLSNPEMVKYQTILEGYSADWSSITNSMEATYEKVGHGEYTFRLRGFNENGIPTEKPETFIVRIKKPIYLSPWFYILLAAFLIVSLYQYIKLREKNMRTTQERLIKNLDEKTKEIIVKEEIIKERKRLKRF